MSEKKRNLCLFRSLFWQKAQYDISYFRLITCCSWQDTDFTLVILQQKKVISSTNINFTFFSHTVIQIVKTMTFSRVIYKCLHSTVPTLCPSNNNLSISILLIWLDIFCLSTAPPQHIGGIHEISLTSYVNNHRVII